MRTLAAPVLALLAAGQVGVVQLVLIEFPSGDVALNSSNYDLVWDGVLYKGAFGLGAVSPIADSAGEVKGITLELLSADSASLSLALDAADEVQGAPATIRSALIEDTAGGIVVRDAPIDFTGRCDRMTIAEDGQTCAVSVSVESAAVDMLRGNASTYSDADQRALYTGDRAFEHIVAQADKRDVWPAREYFFK